MAQKLSVLLVLLVVLVLGSQAQTTLQDVFSFDPVSFDKKSEPKPLVGYFLREMSEVNEPWTPLKHADVEEGELAKLEWLAGVRWYRLLPSGFPREMHYHFDGLAQVLSIHFTKNSSCSSLGASYFAKSFHSEAEEHWKHCVFFGTGTGPTPGVHPCAKNPGVNLLPLGDQLWLTIDTVLWGRVDPHTLETLPGAPRIRTLVLNAHPSHDYEKNVTYVQHPCPPTMVPDSDQVCVSTLETIPGQNTNLKHTELARARTPNPLLIQHSHSPCITPNYFVSKLDSFEPREQNATQNGGLLRFLHQAEGDEWIVMDRNTNETSILRSNFSFVNNHFWNCYEKDGKIVADSVTATSDYLDTYFTYRLAEPPQWNDIFSAPQRCYVPTSGDPSEPTIACEPLLEDKTVLFDYPTYNPLWKLNPDYQFFYGIAPRTLDSLWVDSVIKMNKDTRKVVGEWHQENVYVTEFDFIPNPEKGAAEDDGLLLSIGYDQVKDESFIIVLNAKTMTLIATLPLAEVVPFHAHGIGCFPDKTGKQRCFTNP